MPYKIEGSAVFVQKGGKWQLLKRHKTHSDALAHFRALQANVPEAHEKKGPKK